MLVGCEEQKQIWRCSDGTICLVCKILLYADRAFLGVFVFAGIRKDRCL